MNGGLAWSAQATGMDTFRQAVASGICWMMLAVTAVCYVLCLSVNVSGDVALHGGRRAAFFPATTPGPLATWRSSAYRRPAAAPRGRS